jgi:D-glycero-D-manno-heptose 1,7-bisphosphate phosphatase
MFLDSDHIWSQVIGTPAWQQPRPALFLDRDGVIVEEVDYLHRLSDVVLIPGAAETIAAAKRLGVPVVIVTNQAGIGRGYYGWMDFMSVQEAILAELSRSGAAVDGVFACPYHPHGVAPYAHPDHPARKPQPGMLLRAAEMMGIDLRRSWIVGDKSSDLMAGRAAGLRGGLLVLTGYGSAHREATAALQSTEFEVRIGPSIRTALALTGLDMQVLSH